MVFPIIRVVMIHCAPTFGMPFNRNDFWNNPCGGIRQNTNPNPNLSNFKALAESIKELVIYNEQFLVNYAAPDYRISHGHRDTLNFWSQPMPKFLPASAKSLSNLSARDALTESYRTLSYVAVFSLQIARNELAYEQGPFIPIIQEYHSKIYSCQCDLAHVMSDWSADIPSVPIDVLGNYATIPLSQLRHDFGYLVLRDSLEALMHIMNTFDDFYILFQSKEASSTLAPGLVPTTPSNNP